MEKFEITEEIFPLWEGKKMPFENPDSENIPLIKAYIVNKTNSPAVVFFPGGGYDHISVRESAQIPVMLNNLGISVFLLEYRVAPYTADAILADAFRSIRFVRANAKKYHIDTNKIGVMGCSAGGHLAASVSNLYSSAEKYICDDTDNTDAKVNFAVLCYPVISLTDNLTHPQSRENFLGKEFAHSKEKQLKYSAECNACELTPPTFIWHTVKDESVSVKNSLAYAAALSDKGVKTELHIYPEGGHALAIAAGVERTSDWTSELSEWLRYINVV